MTSPVLLGLRTPKWRLTPFCLPFLDPPAHNIATKKQDDADDECRSEQESEHSDLKGQRENSGDRNDPEYCDTKETQACEWAGSPFH